MDSKSKAFSYNWGVFSALWLRDVMRLAKERSRWFGVALQPLLFWLVMGFGMSRGFNFVGPNNESYIQYFFPGTVVLSVLFTAIFSVISIIEDRQAGFLQGVLVAPGSRFSIILGKTAGVGTIVALQVLFFTLVAPAAGFRLENIEWFSYVIVTTLGTVGLVALNFACAWMLNSSQAYHAVMSIVLLPLWVVSGAVFPLNSAWLLWVSKLNPIYFFVDGYRSALLGNALSLEVFLFLLLYALLFLFLCVAVLNKTRSEAA